MDNSSVYITVLHDSLSRKADIVKEILTLTKEQRDILSSQEVDADRFDEIMKEVVKVCAKVEPDCRILL